MRRRDVLALLGGALLSCPTARAQEVASQSESDDSQLTELIVGTWMFVSSSTINIDGTKTDRWGPDVHGILMFDRHGHFAQVVMRPRSRLFGARVLSSFGTYKVTGRKLVTLVEGGSTPHVVGREQRRIIVSLTETELRYINPTSSSGGRVEAIWRRAK